MKFTIATPFHTSTAIHPAFKASLDGTREAFGDRVTWSELGGCADISLARNTLLHRFRAGRDDAIVFIDADVSWTPDDLSNVLAPLESGAAHVSSAIYVRKAHPVHPVADLLESDCSESEGYIGPVHEIGDRRFCRLRFCGGGFMAMTRHAIETVAKRVPSYTPWAGWGVTGKLDERAAWLFRSELYTDERQNLMRHRGEDATACAELRSAGFEIWASLDATPIHHAGPNAFGGQPLDLNAFARRLAFSNDVMRAASEGRNINPVEMRRRTAAMQQ